MPIGTCWRIGSGKKSQTVIRRALREIDPDPADAVVIEVGEAVDAVAIAVPAVVAETIALALEIAHRATKSVQQSPQQAPATPRVVSASDRHDRVAASELTTTEVHAARIGRAVNAGAIVMSDPEMNRVAPHRRLKARLRRASRRKNLEISVSASLKKHRNRHQRRRLDHERDCDAYRRSEHWLYVLDDCGLDAFSR